MGTPPHTHLPTGMAVDAKTRFLSFFRKNRTVMLLIDPDNAEIIEVNPAACTFFGYSEEELKSRKITDLNICTGAEPCETEEAAATDDFRLHVRHCHKTGEVHYLDIFVWPIVFRNKCFTVVVVHDVVDRKRAEEMLAEAKKSHLRLFEISPALIWRTDPSGRFEYFNPNWLEYTGRRMQEEYGDGWAEGIHPKDSATFSREFQHAFRQKIPFETEFRLRRHDGEYRWFQNFGKPFRDEDGSFGGYVGYCLDKTDQHETEEILRKLSRAVEQSASSIVITDTEGCIEYANGAYTRMSGYGLEDIIGRNRYREEAGLDLPDVFGESWETVKSGGEWRGELQMSKKGGDLYWEFATFSPIANNEEVITHFLAVKEDITARKKAEEELAKSRAELSVKHEELQCAYEQVARSQKEWANTMDCLGDTVILVDPQGKIRRCNKALKELTGQDFPEMIGESCREMLSRHGLYLPDDLSAGETLHQVNGRWFICKSYPFTTDAAGEVSGSVVTIHDFTERKRVNSELEQAYCELKATQARIVQQEKMASIGQLAAGVAHEINNPMGFISSNLRTLAKYNEKQHEFIKAQSAVIETLMDAEMADALRDKRRALKIDYILEDGRELIKESLDGAERVRTIVQNLKSFSRVDEVEFKLTDINVCITSTINIVWSELKYKVNLVKELSEIPPLLCYPQQINQVIMNLLVNAGQAIEKQGEITVRSWHENGSIYASVSDTGCGIPSTVLNRIFEPFFTTKDVGKGTGLGLSITYDIVKNHDGEITVESEPGKGTTFTIRLPMVSDKRLP